MLTSSIQLILKMTHKNFCLTVIWSTWNVARKTSDIYECRTNNVQHLWMSHNKRATLLRPLGTRASFDYAKHRVRFDRSAKQLVVTIRQQQLLLCHSDHHTITSSFHHQQSMLLNTNLSKIDFIHEWLHASRIHHLLLRIAAWHRQHAKLHKLRIYNNMHLCKYAFSALMLLVWQQEERPAWKKYGVMRCWRGYLPGTRCKWHAYGAADATATPSSLLHLVLDYPGCPGKKDVKRCC